MSLRSGQEETSGPSTRPWRRTQRFSVQPAGILGDESFSLLDWREMNLAYSEIFARFFYPWYKGDRDSKAGIAKWTRRRAVQAL